MVRLFAICLFLPLSGVMAQNIAVITLTNNGGLTDGETEIITDQVGYELSKYRQFSILERKRINEILKEQGFQQSGACNDQSCLVEVGQLLAVQKIFSGSIGKIGNMFNVNLKIIDMNSGKITKQLTDNIKTSKENLLAKHIPQMIQQLVGDDTIVGESKPLLKKTAFWVPASAALLVAGGIVIYFFAASEDDDTQESGGLSGVDVGTPTRPTTEPW